MRWPCEMLRHFSADAFYQELLSGRCGANILDKYSVTATTKMYKDILAFLVARARDCLDGKLGNGAGEAAYGSELDDIERYLLSKNEGLFCLDAMDSVLTSDFGHDLLAWSHDRTGALGKFKRPCRLAFDFGDTGRRKIITSYLENYPSSMDGLAKILTRETLTTFQRRCVRVTRLTHEVSGRPVPRTVASRTGLGKTTESR